MTKADLIVIQTARGLLDRCSNKNATIEYYGRLFQRGGVWNCRPGICANPVQIKKAAINFIITA